MITRSVTIEPIDELYLQWNDYLNASALYREALREEMATRDVDPTELRELVERAQEQGYSLDEIVARTDRVADLRDLVDDQQPSPASDPTPE